MLVGLVLFCKAPELLKKRLSGKETEKTQRGVVALSGLMFPVGFVLSALDFRFAWSEVPFWLVIVASVLFLLGSLWALIPFAFYPVIIVPRILNEEKVLTDGLLGYEEYKTKVKYRLIPFIW